MKMIVAAAALAALTTTPAFAQEAAGGHYEWQSRTVPGPNKSGIAPRERVWVKDKTAQMADRDCDMMKAMHGQPAKG